MRIGLARSETARRVALARMTRSFCFALCFAVATGGLASPPAFAAEASRALLAANLDPAKTAECHRVNEVTPALFGGRDITAYDFTGESARKLKQVMDSVVEQAVPDASLIHLVVVRGTDHALAFLFGRDGCHTVTVELDLASMDTVFANAGVAAPFDKGLQRLNGIAI
jgi:hypothetical protein